MKIPEFDQSSTNQPHLSDIAGAPSQLKNPDAPNAAWHSLALAPQLPLHQAPAGVIQLKEDWNFTPDDYGSLTKTKGKLKFDSDSDWFTQPFKENLLATLNELLDPKRKAPATQGINVSDFFHGHVVVKGSGSQRLKDLRDEHKYQREEQNKKHTGSEVANVTEKNLPNFRKAVAGSMASATAILVDVAKEKDAAVLYHTFEYNNPLKLKAGSSQRNYMTPLGGKPSGYSPPDPDGASSAYRDYLHLLQFAFLVDETGVIHVRPGSISELSTVTGKPEKDRSSID